MRINYNKKIIKTFCFISVFFLLFYYCDKTVSSEDSLKDKVAIITGTSSGLGKALAELAAQKGMKLVLVDINLGPSRELASRIEQNGGEAVAIRVDLANANKRKEIVDIAMKRFKKIDYLINSAAYIYAARVENLELEESHRLFEVNFWAYLDLANRVIPIMKEQGGGTIINIASIAGLSAYPVVEDIGIYVASKHALVGLFKTLALEIGEYNINIKIVCPAAMKTNILKNAVGPAKEKLFQFSREFHPDHYDTPEDIAAEIFSNLDQKEVIILPGKAKISLNTSRY